MPDIADLPPSTEAVVGGLDTETILKAAQAISSEINLGGLLEKLLTIAMENAGARRGALILEREGSLFVEAEGSAGGEIGVLGSRRLETGEDADGNLPSLLIGFVVRSGESVVLDDAGKDGRFGKDPYFRRSRARSVLCSPMRDKGKTSGIIYLENDLVAGAFAPERLKLLDVLFTQAAISIENATLYADLEKQKLHEREAMEREIVYKYAELRSRRLELELLKKTIHPHFLMNTLTAIRSWLMEKPKKSIQLIDALSEELRPIFSHSDMKLIPLSEEIEMCRSHLDVMGLRLDKKFSLSVVGLAGDETIPPLVFHTMVENTFTHNDPYAFSGFNLEKSATAWSVQFVFSVDGVATEEGVAAEEGTVREGTGMRYVRARLEESYPGRWSLSYSRSAGVWKAAIEIRESVN